MVVRSGDEGILLARNKDPFAVAAVGVGDDGEMIVCCWLPNIKLSCSVVVSVPGSFPVS